MIDIRPFDGLGRFRNAWLNARYHFSFSSYRHPSRMGFGPILVWNDDEIAPGSGFDPHPHHEMEIITYVREGAVTHRDNFGNEGRTEAGDVQVMHAGTGIVHGEYNREAEPTRLFQIWIRPDRAEAPPSWATRRFSHAIGTLNVLASGRSEDQAAGALALYADAALLAGRLDPGQSLRQRLDSGRLAYLVPARGALAVNGQLAGPRDGIAIVEEPELMLSAIGGEPVELIMVEAKAAA